ncbi:AcrR family transcriptional regulator [Actinoplanes octamycinicus]|uniref:AcrR family transcriptional regulator n=1 Tax=Actinoplanes octamycinicus TaxID=135948 RepID=A0A7W7M7N7_9ACTN|nr:TetR/AcrR family transcriptional regulator C-terminal domain-containing protein [Actinoplanes octamycinicus]MBB4740087.1 AcrR family transcriptional regulator [Actinoplanes octamycinicus]GIE59483.1 TetR family transcriptional regulator [Actinoplanes octamycinicus]
MDVAERRVPLNRERVLLAAVDLADRTGLDALSMRNLAQELGVVPMALYKHVANKDELLDGMVDTVVAGIPAASPAGDWKTAVRERILGARRALLRHPWAWRVINSRTDPTPAMLAHLDAVIGLFLTGGFTPDQVHHFIHTLGTRLLGYTPELFNDATPLPPEAQLEMARAMAPRFPNLALMAMSAAHEAATVVGSGCDDQFEFEFALDLLLDGFDRLPRPA